MSPNVLAVDGGAQGLARLESGCCGGSDGDGVAGAWPGTSYWTCEHGAPALKGDRKHRGNASASSGA